MPELLNSVADRTLLASIVDSSDDAIIAKSLDGIILSWSHGAEILYGYSAAEIIGKPIAAIIPPDRPREADDILARLRRGERIERYETRRLRKDGTPIAISLTVSPIYDSEGKLIGISSIGRDISERQQARAALRTQENLLRSIIDSSGDYIYAKDRELRTIVCNQAFAKALGRSATEICGKTDIENGWDPALVYGDPASGIRGWESDDRKALAGETVHTKAEPGNTLQGTRYFDTVKSPLRNDRGDIIGLVGFSRDITGQVRMEEDLRRASAYNRNLLEASLDPLVTIDNGGKITDVNEATVKVTGVSRHELIGTDFSDYFTGPEEAREGYRQVFSQGSVTDYPLTIRHREGRLTRVLYNATVYRDEQGQVAGVFAAARDVTAQVQAQSALRASHAQLSELVRVSLRVVGETTVEALLQTVADSARGLTGGRIAAAGHGYVNGVFRTAGASRAPGTPECPPGEVFQVIRGGVYLGLIRGDENSIRLSDEQLRSHPAWWGLPHGHVPLHGLLGVRLIDGNGNANGLIMVSGKQGEFTELDEAALQQLGAIASLALQHIEARTDVERQSASLQQSREQLRELNETLERRIEQRTAQLEEANRELEAFSYSVSHDLRAPLRAVEGFANILVRDYPGKPMDAKAADYMQRMGEASRRMGNLIEDLLALARLSRHQLQRQRVNLSELASAVLAELANREPLRIVEAQVEPGLFADADRRLLSIVLENLLGNAWKFTGKTGRPVISFDLRRDREKPAYCVRDNGAGFDMAYAGQLFLPFQRLHSSTEFEGSGIGLATVQRIVRRHGGEIWAEAAVGQGARFYFTLGET